MLQASRQYNKKFSKVMVNDLGFQQCKSDPCLFYRENEDGIAVILTYVDDNLCVGHTKALEKLIEEVPKYGLQITVERKLTDYLSCEIVMSDDRKQAWIGQPHMVNKLTKTFKDEVNKRVRVDTPGTPGQSLIKVDDELKIDKERQSRYRTGVGMLLYLIKHSRPDLCNAVRELSKCLDGPSECAYKEMLRVIKYVMDTPYKGLRISPMIPEVLEEMEWVLLLYSDSDWANDKENRKSVGGYMIFLNNVLISWRSKLQRVVSLSSAEAEFYALSEAVKEVPFILQLLKFLHIKVKMPVKVKVDNIGAIYMSQGEASTTRTRHMDTRYFYVNELQEQGIIEVVFVKSEENRADIATKNVDAKVMRFHIDEITAEKFYWR